MKTVKSTISNIPPNVTEPETPVITAPVIAIKVFNTLVLLSFVLFLWAHTTSFIQTLRLSILILLIKAVLEIQVHVRHSTTSFINTSAYAWLISLCGTLAALMFRPIDGVPDSLAGTMMQAIGLAIQVYIISMLNRNSGKVAARQGSSRDGLYHFVRHPIYLAFLFVEFGYLLNHASFYNMFVFTTVVFFQVLRINEEERLLRDDEEFQRYAQQTHWRVIPGVF